MKNGEVKTFDYLTKTETGQSQMKKTEQQLKFILLGLSWDIRIWPRTQSTRVAFTFITNCSYRVRL